LSAKVEVVVPEQVSPSIDEAAVERFEAAWLRGVPQSLESCLPPVDDPRYAATLEELVCIELECAWKAWCRDASRHGERPAEVARYAAKFAALSQPDVLARVAEQEFRLRRRFGDQPSSAEYVRRFGDVARAWEADVSTQLPTTSASSDVKELPCLPGEDSPLAAPPRYALVAVHGRGGFGCVWRAPAMPAWTAKWPLSNSTAA
jgi:hypothetical protein